MNAKNFTPQFFQLFLSTCLIFGFQISFAQNQCMDPMATFQFDNSASNDDCCWFININSTAVSNQLTAVQFHNFIDCEIGTLTTSGPWTINTQSSTDAIIHAIHSTRNLQSANPRLSDQSNRFASLL